LGVLLTGLLLLRVDIGNPWKIMTSLGLPSAIAVRRMGDAIATAQLISAYHMMQFSHLIVQTDVKKPAISGLCAF
jgi:hypothetical protein